MSTLGSEFWQPSVHGEQTRQLDAIEQYLTQRMIDKNKTGPQTFHPFARLSAELQVRIWQEAIIQDGPRIVELAHCEVDHTVGKCYIAGHRHSIHDDDSAPNNDDGKGCCFHWENPLKQNRSKQAACRCTRSQRTHRYKQRYGEVQDLEDTNLDGHTRRAEIHLCRRANSKLSPLLRTCVASRYEVTRLGHLSYVPDADSERWDPQKPVWDHPIWFNFGFDILALSFSTFDALETNGGKLLGSDRVKSLIIRPAESEEDEASLQEFEELLDTFSNLEDLTVAQHESGGTSTLR